MTVKLVDSEILEYEAGFRNSPEQRTPVRLVVTGKIPSWFSGHLYRCAPSTFEIDNLSPAAIKANHGKDTFKITHWFDGLTQIHKFSVNDDGSVDYMSRKTAEKAEQYIREKWGLRHHLWPTRSLPDFFLSLLYRRSIIVGLAGGSSPNVGVTLSPNFPLLDPKIENKNVKAGPRTLVAKTDASVIQELDPVTLEPISFRSYSGINKSIPGPISAAHGQFDSDTREYFNYAIELGEVLATIQNVPASYMHSFALTDRYVIYFFWPYATETFNFLWVRNFAESLTFNPKRPTLLAVIDRQTNSHVATFRAPAAFGFHTINAWDESWPRLHRYRLKSVSTVATSVSAWKKLSGSDKELETLPIAEITKLSDAGIELPRFHPKDTPQALQVHLRISSTSTTIYAVNDNDIDVSTLPARHFVWHEPGSYPGEPVFVPRPGAEQEDDGILVSVVLKSGRGVAAPSSYLLEVARAEMPSPHVVPFGFHGNFYDGTAGVVE
ncbi:carotenoid oxygenase, partial [Chytridium lagenaria]